MKREFCPICDRPTIDGFCNTHGEIDTLYVPSDAPRNTIQGGNGKPVDFPGFFHTDATVLDDSNRYWKEKQNSPPTIINLSPEGEREFLDFIKSNPQNIPLGYDSNRKMLTENVEPMIIKTCKKCKLPLEMNDNFCRNCGKKSY